jgi:hypothetical protein
MMVTDKLENTPKNVFCMYSAGLFTPLSFLLLAQQLAYNQASMDTLQLSRALGSLPMLSQQHEDGGQYLISITLGVECARKVTFAERTT